MFGVLLLKCTQHQAVVACKNIFTLAAGKHNLNVIGTTVNAGTDCTDPVTHAAPVTSTGSEPLGMIVSLGSSGGVVELGYVAMSGW